MLHTDTAAPSVRGSHGPALRQHGVIAVALGADADATATGDRFSDSRSLLEFGLSA